ncbi:MAG: hypothetical protein ACREN8_09130, partial [Candidatus Dormibacteraceae bacterium]
GMDAALQAGEHADQSGEDATSEIAQAAQPYLNQAMVVDANSPQAFARDVRRVIDGEQPSSSQNEDSPIYGGNQDHLSALTKNINSDGGGCGGCNRINTNSGRQNNLLLQCADKQSAETQRTSLIIRQIAGLIMQLCQTSPGYCNAPGGQKGTIGGPIQISNIDSPGLPSGTFTPLPTTIGQGGLGENIALPPPPSTSDQSGLGGSSSLPPLPSPNGGSLPSLARVVMTPDTTA